MTKPWADPLKPLEERLMYAEVAVANVDTAPERRAIMGELVGCSLEQAAGKLSASSSGSWRRAALLVRSLKT